MEKKQFIEESLERLTKFWFYKVYTLGSLLFMGLGILDYISTPENFGTFMLYRGAVVIILLTAAFYVKKATHHYSQFAAFFVVVVASAIVIELMILQFGGYKSTYYVGLILLSICVVGLIPVRVYNAIAAVILIYAIYLVPILILEKEINFRIFFTPNAFLVSVLFTEVVWRYFHEKSLVNEFSLQYDIQQQKQQLEVYSTQLEDLVQQRTKDLTVSEKKYRGLFDYANDGVILTDRTGMIVDVNEKGCEIHAFEKSALLGVNLELLEVDENKRIFRDRWREIVDGNPMMFETQHYRKDGARVSVEISARTVEIEGKLYVQAFHRDITDKKQLQTELFHSQKMESIGLLAGGIAHNFNNVLTGILGYTELLRMDPDIHKDAKEKVNIIEMAARKAGDVVTKLLSFARKQKQELVPFSVNHIVNDTMALVEKAIDRKIGVKLLLTDNIPAVQGDPNLMEQVVMNLIVNARDAMPDGGLITIKSGVINVRKGFSLDVPPYIQDGEYVLLEVSDSGFGIPDEIINKIFEPFYTTKEKGKGTGLGLSMVYGTVKDHKGYITVKSKVKEGSVFSVYLPVSAKSIPAIVHSPASVVRAGHETILVIDDDEYALSFMRDILEINGYKVFAANSSVAGFDKFRSVPKEISLVVTDVVMPLMDCKSLVGKMKTIKPEIKIIAVSGYAGVDFGETEKLLDGFVKKPFSSEQLIAIVRRALSSEQNQKKESH